MSIFFESFKRHVVEYYLFYLLAYGLVLPQWFNLLPLFLYKNMNVAPSLLLITMGLMLVSVAGSLKHYQPKWKILHRALLVVGLLIQVVSLVKLFKPALSHAAVALPLVISLVVSVWWIVVYFLDLLHLNREKNKLIGKKVLKYFIVCAILLYAPSVLLSQYYKKQLSAILAAGSVHVAGGLDYIQIEKMMDEKVWQAKGLASLLTIFVLILFFYFYRRVKNSVMQQL